MGGGVGRDEHALVGTAPAWHARCGGNECIMGCIIQRNLAQPQFFLTEKAAQYLWGVYLQALLG